MPKRSFSKLLILVMALFVVAGALPVMSAASATPTQVYLTHEAVDVYASDRAGAPVIGQVEKGMKLYALEEVDGMVRIAFGGQAGWVRLEALKLPEPEPDPELEEQKEEPQPAIAVLTVDANLRKGPSTRYDVIEKLKEGTELTVLSSGTSYYKVQAGSQIGYVLISATRLTSGYVLPSETAAITYEPIKGDSKHMVLINIDTQVGSILEKDEDGYYTQLVRCFPVSTGKGNGTPRGIFKTLTTHRWQLMKGDVYTQYAVRFKSSFLLHSVPYSRKDASSLLSREYNKLGNVASSGCVRMRVVDSKWIYDNCPLGTTVQIVNSGTYPTIPVAVAFDPIDTSIRWDPTDPDPKNPYYDWDEE